MDNKGENFQKRATVRKTSGEPVEHQVRFETQRFNSLIFDKGYEVWVDKALRCPCSVKGSGQPLISCNNCLGVGWIFVDRFETRIAVQSIKADVKYENWTKTTAGTSNITARAIDKLSFMDRIILKEVEGYYNEIIRHRKDSENNIYFLTEYPVLEIESIFLFDNDKSPLIRLKNGEDFKIERESKIILLPNDNINSLLTKNKFLTISLRYKHYMTYHILEMNRDIVKVREKGCLMSEEQLKNMPVNGIARKAHYLFDNIKYEQENRLIEN